MFSSNTHVGSSAHVAPRKGLSQRTYATQRPTLPKGLQNNRPLLIAGLVAIPAMAYFMMPARPKPASSTASASRAPNLDPAADKRARDEGTHHKYVHPEHEHPEDFKPRFGEVHKRKRVDMPPDGRHHQSLSDRARVHE